MSGHPMSELTRKILMKLKKEVKKWPDAARNKDDVFNAENIKATSVNPHDQRFHALDNSEKYSNKLRQESNHK